MTRFLHSAAALATALLLSTAALALIVVGVT